MHNTYNEQFNSANFSRIELALCYDKTSFMSYCV